MDPFEHIRMISLSKIKIADIRQWDVAKYDQFCSKGIGEEINKSAKNKLKSKSMNLINLVRKASLDKKKKGKI